MTDATGTDQVPDSTVTVAAESRGASPSQTRRRLILAAGAALPSVYTLSSGANTAAASNLACLAKQGTPPPRFTTDADYARWPDNWVRAPVAYGDYDGIPADCVTTPQSSCSAFTPVGSGGASSPSKSGDASSASKSGGAAGASKFGDASGDFKFGDASGAGTDAADGSVWIIQGERHVSNRNVPVRNIKLGRKHYGLVYVDQSGTVATLDPQGTFKLTPVTTSCWASIMGGRISKLG
jgi:hypothetical protein